MSSAVRVSLIGAAGRMGQAISRAAELQRDVSIVARCSRGDRVEEVIAQSDVAIDVSHADAVEQICAAGVDHRKALVIGTTGHSAAQSNAIHTAARQIAVVLAPNFSVGVNALFWLARKSAELLGDSFDIEIIESHHRMKKDAPSGTAKELARQLGEARGADCSNDVQHGRRGMIGERPRKQIGMHSLRGGDVVGEHTVVFAGDGERLELTHRASSRETFALGALRAARWIATQPAGLYTMQDVLGIGAER